MDNQQQQQLALDRISCLSNHLQPNLTSTSETTATTAPATASEIKEKKVIAKSKIPKAVDDIESDGSFSKENLHLEELDIIVELNGQTGVYEMRSIPTTLSFDQGFFHAIRAIEMLAESNPQRLIVVGVAGPVGAGKTTLALKMSGLVGAIVIDLQDFVKMETVKDNNYDDPVSINFDLVVDTINALRRGETVTIPKLIKHPSAPTGAALLPTIESQKITMSGSRVVIIEGSYALTAKLRPLLDLTIAITGGVHLDLIKRIMRDIVVAKSSTKDVLLQITNVVFPMFKAFVEPDLDQAKIKIHSSYNPMSQVVEPTFVCKAKYETHKDHFDAYLASLNSKPVKKHFSDMYLYPPKKADGGLSQADKTNWIRIRRTDKGQFNIYFYREIMDGTINTRPSLNFEISVKTIGGLLSLGYQIGAILNRTVEVWYEKSGVVITKEYIKELEKYFIQIKGQNRREVLSFADKLKLTNIHVPQTFLYLYFKKLKKNKLRAEQPELLKKNNTRQKIRLPPPSNK
ncbi:adenylate cyclase domain-containing protein [Cavenderia fasciculata]|uniref:Adenylate cyclase domain-containing protein n=1 Tax=Cavenderia fasciculata TaxID=261658 RepID=F4PQA5_CACFS|nr:adenylate cyclase domain-containing protein [Cavenderia fasciculata]EGG22568.1 adenylate cyclase domain-containing protein [Cavenderia fasciculata]|eukprot:XP_004360419.1 adenylate cyclase domain-containing protein [Cavenderia fasciculata]